MRLRQKRLQNLPPDGALGSAHTPQVPTPSSVLMVPWELSYVRTIGNSFSLKRKKKKKTHTDMEKREKRAQGQLLIFKKKDANRKGLFYFFNLQRLYSLVYMAMIRSLLLDVYLNKNGTANIKH